MFNEQRKKDSMLFKAPKNVQRAYCPLKCKFVQPQFTLLPLIFTLVLHAAVLKKQKQKVTHISQFVIGQNVGLEKTTEKWRTH